MEQQTQQQSEEVKIEDPAAVLGALERAKSEAKKFREEKEKLESDLENSTKMLADYSSKLLQEKIKSKFDSNGIKDSSRFMRFIDVSQLSLNENNEIVGFEDQFNSLKEDLPELFDAKLRVGGQADTAASTTVNTRISATELQARQILGKI
tara:strand:- start:369 stop:821 length:453 start_codon:yes stop_codon:yes gene_type:complete